MDPKAGSSQMGQVPVEAEHNEPAAPTALDSIDIIHTAPPPYSPHIATESKSAGPPLEMVDLHATVRGLPQVHMIPVPVPVHMPMHVPGASADAGPSSSMNASVRDGDGSVNSLEESVNQPRISAPATPIETAQSILELPPAPIGISNSASTTSFRTDDSGVSDVAKPVVVNKNTTIPPSWGKIRGPIWLRREVFGCNICFLIIAFIVTVLVVGVATGVTLWKKHSREENYWSNDRFVNPEWFSKGKFSLATNYTNSPTQYGSCLSPQAHLPEIEQSEQVLWSCERANRNMTVQITWEPDVERDRQSNVKSYPTLLPPNDASDGRYMSYYIDQYISTSSHETDIFEGVQPLKFYQIPLRKLSQPFNANSTETYEYEFRFLHDKEIILRTETVQNLIRYRNATIKDVRSLPGLYNNTRINNLESVWRCVWNQTLLQGHLKKSEVVVETQYTMTRSYGGEENFTSPSLVDYMSLRLTEMRPTIAQIEDLYGVIKGPGRYDRGDIACQKMVLEDGVLRREVAGSSPILMVEKVEAAVDEKFLGGFSGTNMTRDLESSFSPRGISGRSGGLQKRAGPTTPGCGCLWIMGGVFIDGYGVIKIP